MSLLGPNDGPIVTPAERLRDAAWFVLFVLFMAGFAFVTFGGDRPEVGGGNISVIAFLLGVAVSWLLSLRKVVGWLEWKRRIRRGEWRTTRASRLGSLTWALWMLGYGVEVLARTTQARSLGDQPRFVVGVAVVMGLVVFVALVVRRGLGVAVELSVDREGVRAAEWRGVLPWAAIESVISPKSSTATDELRLVLKPEALPSLPDAVRRWNGYPRIYLGKVNLSPDEALAALRAVHPALRVGARTAGVVLPVPGATDIVEADL